MNPDAAGGANRNQVPACGPDDLSVTVRWERDGDGLRGQVIAENTGGRAAGCRASPVSGRSGLTASRCRSRP